MIAAELDLCPAYGWQGGPEFYTRVVTLRNGHERRNANWAGMRHRYILPFHNITDVRYLLDLKAVFAATMGRTESFLVKDWSDHDAVGQSIGNAPSGSTGVQLVKTYVFGPTTYTRNIEKPITGTVTVYQAGIAKAGTINTSTGVFTPSTSWTEGQPLTADFEFMVPVRFASDSLNMSIDNRNGTAYVMNGSVELVEVFGE